MSPFVERVVKTLPHVQRTVASTYSGWISVFMVYSSVDAVPCRPERWEPGRPAALLGHAGPGSCSAWRHAPPVRSGASPPRGEDVPAVIAPEAER